MTAGLLMDTLVERVDAVFGEPNDPMWALDLRAREALCDEQAMVWECDASTFECWHASPAAEDVLGYPRERWFDRGFWAGTVVHPEDREDVVDTCALWMGGRGPREIAYRAVDADGRVVRVQHFVMITTGDDGAPESLRSVMVVDG